MMQELAFDANVKEAKKQFKDKQDRFKNRVAEKTQDMQDIKERFKKLKTK